MRERIGWRGLAGAGAILVVAGVAFLGWRLTVSPASAESVAADAPAARGNKAPVEGGTSQRTVTVYVSGAVERPGMYRLAAGLRVGDALAAAGGATHDADPDRMPNVAAKLTDGKQIKVPRLRGRTGSASARVDINTASATELAAVPGMPPGLAQEIVDFRGRYGPFASVAELKTSLGVDAATLASLRRYLTVAG